VKKTKVIQQWYPDDADLDHMRRIADRTRKILKESEDQVYILTVVGKTNATNLMRVGRSLSLDFPGRAHKSLFVGIRGIYKILFQSYQAVSKSENIAVDTIAEAKEIIRQDAETRNVVLEWVDPNQDGLSIGWLSEEEKKKNRFKVNPFAYLSMALVILVAAYGISVFI
jgi:hypothetical protein